MKKLFSLTAASLIFCLIVAAHASDAPVPTQGGQVLSDGHNTVEFKVEHESKSVKVFLQRPKNDFPGVLGITLYDAENRPTTFEVRAMNTTSGSLATYEGKYSAPELTKGSSTNEQLKSSFLGIEIRIPFGKGKKNILRSSLK